MTIQTFVVEIYTKWYWFWLIINVQWIFHIFIVLDLQSLQRWKITEWVWKFLESIYPNGPTSEKVFKNLLSCSIFEVLINLEIVILTYNLIFENDLQKQMLRCQTHGLPLRYWIYESFISFVELLKELWFLIENHGYKS